jgi:[ribosomal protein S5]-alanine N-acetyltransferase
MIETERLELVPCQLKHFEAIINNESELDSVLQVTRAEGWLGFPEAIEAMEPSYEYLKTHPTALGWWTYLFVLKADRKLIGLGGFKGEATDDGIVEFGYALAPSYRGRGLATEASRGMIQYAFNHPFVTEVIAHTLPEHNPSTRVLKRAGLRFTSVVNDPSHGEVWRWSLTRRDFDQ